MPRNKKNFELMYPQEYRLFKKEWSFLMAKHSFEFKLKLVQEYLSGEGGYPSLCENILSHALLFYGGLLYIVK